MLQSSQRPDATGFWAAVVLAVVLSACGSSPCDNRRCGSACCPNPSCNVYNTDDPACMNCSYGYCNKDGDCVADAGVPVCV